MADKINTIQVKNSLYDIEDKEFTKTLENINKNTNQENLDMNSIIPFSNGDSLKTNTLLSVANTLVGGGECSTLGEVAAKTVTINSLGTFTPYVSTIIVKFQYANTANDITLNVNGKGAKPIVAMNGGPSAQLGAGSIPANSYLKLVYTDEAWLAETNVVKKESDYTVLTDDKYYNANQVNSTLANLQIISQKATSAQFTKTYNMNSYAIIFVSSGYLHAGTMRSCDVYILTSRVDGGSVPQITKIENGEQGRNSISITANQNGKFTIEQVSGTSFTSTYIGFIL